MVDLLKRVEETLQKGLSVWIDYTEGYVEGFSIEVSYVGREELSKLYEKYTKKKYSRKTKRMEEILDRDSLIESWADRAIKNWKGLTMEKVAKILPIELSKEDNPNAVVPCEHDNRVALIRHNSDFETFIVDACTDTSMFSGLLKQKEKEAENL